MNSFLLNRQLGSISPQSLVSAQSNRLLRSLQAAPNVHFAVDGKHSFDAARGNGDSADAKNVAHAAGVSSIAIDPFEGRYLLSAGADSSVAIWDLEAVSIDSTSGATHVPLSHITRTSTTSTLGVTQTSFYPFDSLAFLTTNYDHTLKLHSSETLRASASFDLGSIVYSHATSSIATSHLLVACASQHPAVRLVDLNSGSSTHSLTGHSGSVLAVAWHPKNEHILASGASDGTLRLWDIRRSASSLGVLDMDDSTGIAGFDGKGTGARSRERGRAHNGAVNGLAWTSDGQYLVSIGHDERMRVWDMCTGANTVANFGPGLKNSTTTALYPVLAPRALSPAGTEVVFYPNVREVPCFDLHSGAVISRGRIATAVTRTGLEGLNSGIRNAKPRTTSLAWRAHDVELYSGHADGVIRCWRPRTVEDIDAEQEDHEEERIANGSHEEEVERKRKRDELESIVQDLTKKRVTYS